MLLSNSEPRQVKLDEENMAYPGSIGGRLADSMRDLARVRRQMLLCFDAADHAGLRISSKLLTLARIVHDPSGPADGRD